MNPTRIALPGRALTLQLPLAKPGDSAGLALNPLIWHTGATVAITGGDITNDPSGRCAPLLAVVTGTWPLKTTFAWRMDNPWLSSVRLDVLAYENALMLTTWEFYGTYTGEFLFFPVALSCSAVSPDGQSATVGPIIARVKIEMH